MKKSYLLEKEAILTAANAMAAAARTAPKTRGVDNIEIISIDDDASRVELIKKMVEISKIENRPSFERDASSIAASDIIIVIGVKPNPSGLSCGFCGYRTCEDLKKTKGICAFNSVDLGIAAASAASAANSMHIDNRIMYSIGRASIDLELFEGDIIQALGIPLSATGKNPFFDRR